MAAGLAITAAIGERDLAYLQGCLQDLVAELRSTGADPTLDALPEAAVPHWLSHFMDTDRGLALKAQREDRSIGFLLGQLTNSAFPYGQHGRVGEIVLCWVEPGARRQGVGRALVRHAEQWFAKRQVTRVELAFLANNALAEQAWTALGYRPFRVQAYKSLQGPAVAGRDEDSR